jgi:hypothetical protein
MLLPDNAATELKQAYNCLIENGVTGIRDRQPEILYLHAMDHYRTNTPTSRLAAERWARAAKHLAGALWHDAKVAHLSPRTAELPYLNDAMAEYHLHDDTDETARSLLSACEAQNCQAKPSGLPGIKLSTWLEQGKSHLASLNEASKPRHELLRAERIKAASEYGRALECVFLALEAEADARESEEMANAKAA